MPRMRKDGTPAKVRQSKKTEPEVLVGTYMTTAMKDQLEQMAKDTNVSRKTLITNMIEDSIALSKLIQRVQEQKAKMQNKASAFAPDYTPTRVECLRFIEEATNLALATEALEHKEIAEALQ